MKFISTIALFCLSPLVYAADAAEQPSSMGPMVFLLAMMGVMYFLVWRPQQKKAKQHASLVDAVKKGDEVLMSSGIVGKVIQTFDHYFEVEIASGVTVLAQKNSVASSLPKGSIKSIKGKTD